MDLGDAVRVHLRDGQTLAGTVLEHDLTFEPEGGMPNALDLDTQLAGNIKVEPWQLKWLGRFAPGHGRKFRRCQCAPPPAG